VNHVFADYDPSIIPVFDAPVDPAVEKIPGSSGFVAVDWTPPDD